MKLVRIVLSAAAMFVAVGGTIVTKATSLTNLAAVYSKVGTVCSIATLCTSVRVNNAPVCSITTYQAGCNTTITSYEKQTSN